ncbi:MAG: flagellar biosynthetic protein FliR [Myxococcales bacterium]|nr:flagellar biosynthetic protein FliR [Myxococcales bacterium]MCB9648053.1 flagellar biosynthetic protein FliR [Deltaproteobacteria bacterium]
MDGAFERIMDVFGWRGALWDPLLLGAIMLMRILPIIFQTPFLGGKMVPTETRMGLAAGLAILVWPYATANVAPMNTNPMVLVALMGKELFIGFSIGFVATELFYAMEFAGRALDTMRGSNMAEVQVPELALRVSPVSQFNFQFLLVIFCALNGHGHFIESIIKSFELVPIDQWPNLTNGFEPMVNLLMEYTSGLFAVAFGLVFPGLFAAFMVDVVFGMFNRIAPQLNAYFMAMGIKAMGGLAMFMFAMTLMAGQLAHQLEDSLKFIRRWIELFN